VSATRCVAREQQLGSRKSTNLRIDLYAVELHAIEPRLGTGRGWRQLTLAARKVTGEAHAELAQLAEGVIVPPQRPNTPPSARSSSSLAAGPTRTMTGRIAPERRRLYRSSTSPRSHPDSSMTVRTQW
jgi:hypothetical protein